MRYDAIAFAKIAATQYACSSETPMPPTLRNAQSLLAPDEPPAYRHESEHGRSPFFLICDHAGRLIPRKLNDLGVAATDLQRHIAWDIGAAGVTRKLAGLLDAFAILQSYSRLVIDCNRPIGSPTSIASSSEFTAIPGNENVTPADAAARQREVFRPYHERIRAELDAREARGQRSVLVSVHSFTPVYGGTARPWHAGVLYHRDHRLALPLLSLLRAEPGLVIGDNEPYSVSDATDYAIPEYGERRGLLHVELEIRQDLIADEAGQSEWAQRLARVLASAIEKLVRA
jgi:predicted N-formylglutamate amidohydrolase